MLWEVPTSPNNLPVLIDLVRKATVFRPQIAKNWEILARHLLRSGEDNEAIAVLGESVSRLPHEPRLHLMLASAYYRARQFDLAHEVLDQAPMVPINDRETTILRLELLMKMSSPLNAAQIATDTLALDPTNEEALRSLAKASRECGRPEIMIPACEAALERAPSHTRARYELAFALTMLGRSEEARTLIDLDQFVAVTELVTPENYADAEAFEAALVDEISRDPTLKPDPVDGATRDGLQTMDGLPRSGADAIKVLLDLIRSAVDAFESNLAVESDHPFVERRPKRVWLNAWAVVYPGNGHQVAHIHTDAWLSGVYYVRVPKISCDDSRRGCLVLGPLEMKGLNLNPPWGTRTVWPTSGRLVMFPSYVPHATIPTKSTETRICIAFDVTPIDPD